MNMTCYILYLVPLRGEINLGPRPQNKILVPFRGHFQKIRRAPPSLLYGSYDPHLLVHVDTLDILPGPKNKQTNTVSKRGGFCGVQTNQVRHFSLTETSVKFARSGEIVKFRSCATIVRLLHFGNFWEQTETKFLRNNNISSSKFMTNSMETKNAGSRFQ